MVVEFVSKNPKHFYMSKYSYWIPPKSFWHSISGLSATAGGVSI